MPARGYVLYWRRWTGWASLACLGIFTVLLVAVLSDPLFWQEAGADVRLLVLSFVYLLILNLTARRIYSVFARQPPLVITEKGFLLGDGFKQRLLAWDEVEKMHLGKTRITFTLKGGFAAGSFWPLLAQFGLEPALRYLYLSVELDGQRFLEAIDRLAPIYFKTNRPQL